MIERAEELVTVFGAAASSAATSANSCSKQRRAGSRRQPRSAQRLFHPAARPGRAVRLRARRHHQPATRPQRGPRRDRCDQPLRRLRPHDERHPCRRRAQCRRGGARCRRRSLVQISAIGADRKRVHLRPTKGEGEEAVRKAFPNATIIRPSLVFGPEDELTNRFAAHGAVALPPGHRRPAQLPAGLCPRSCQGDRAGRARSAALMAARPMRSAGRR